MSGQVGDMVSQIATAASEQWKATEDINTSISQIAGLTQQSSSAAEETAKACTDLSTLAQDLQNLVGQFKLEITRDKPVDAQQPVAPRESRPLKAATATAGR